MEWRFSRSGRSTSSERFSYHTAFGFGRKTVGAIPDFLAAEHYRYRKHRKAITMDMVSTSNDRSTAEDDSISGGLHEILYKKVDGMTVKKRTNGEVSTVENSHSSPSLIAKLMGLDELPQVFSDLRLVHRHCSLKKRIAGTEEKCERSGNQLLQLNRKEQHKVKNVHEPVESSNGKKHSDHFLQKRCSKPGKDFIRHHFVGAKHISTNKTLQNSREFDLLDILDANKNLFVKFLEDPNSLFAKHLHDIRLSKAPSPPSKLKNFKASGRQHFYRSAEENRGYMQIQREVAHCCPKSRPCLVKHCTNVQMDSRLKKLRNSGYPKTTEVSLNSTSAVVLKPHIQKAQSKTRAESLTASSPHDQPGCRRHKEFFQELGLREGKKAKLFDSKIVGYKTEGAREIARCISEQIKHSSSSHSKEMQSSDIHKTGSFSTYICEPSLCRGARNSFSKRWKVSNTFKVGLVAEGSSTSAEMFSSGDAEALDTVDQFTFQKMSEHKVTKEGIHCPSAYPFGKSSSDCWKKKFDSCLLRPGNAQILSGTYGTSIPGDECQDGFMQPIDEFYKLKDVLNLGNNDVLESNIKRELSLLRNSTYYNFDSRHFRSCGEENIMPLRKVEMFQGESRSRIIVTDLCKPKSISSWLLQRNMDNLVHMVHSTSKTEGVDSNSSLKANLKELQQMKNHEHLSANFLDNGVEKVEIVSIDNHSKEIPLNASGHSINIMGPKDSERLSPVSVLKPPSVDGKPAPECLDRFRKGLRDFRRQLDLLELEPADSTDSQYNPFIMVKKSSFHTSDSLGRGAEREFLYLLDVLVISGIYTASENKLLDACYLPNTPIFPDLFDKLEKKHNKVGEWSRAERKLLFDHINSVLSVTLAPFIDLHPWVNPRRTASYGHKRLVQESWRMVVQQRKHLSMGKPEEKVLDFKWLFVDDDVDMIGREIEQMLKDELLDELVSDFIYGYSSTSLTGGINKFER